MWLVKPTLFWTPYFVPSGVVSGPGSGSPPAVSGVSAQRHSDPGFPGLPLLPRHRALHPAHRCPGAAAVRPHCHRPAVSAPRLLVSRDDVECWWSNIESLERKKQLKFRCFDIEMCHYVSISIAFTLALQLMVIFIISLSIIPLTDTVYHCDRNLVAWSSLENDEVLNKGINCSLLHH